jgi:hypothetical protein
VTFIKRALELPGARSALTVPARRAIRHCLIRAKWARDRRVLPLTDEHWDLYQRIHQASWLRLQRFPSLHDCKDFNDRIQWLKLFDQTDAHIRCCDKIRVRDYVQETVGDGYLTKLYQVADTFEAIDFEKLPNSFVMKANHDSGTVVLVRDKAKLEKQSARERLEAALKRPYAWEDGEWAYSFVKPRILVEEFINPDSPFAPADYKFYVAGGRVKFVQYIVRSPGQTSAQVLSPEAEDWNIVLNPEFAVGSSFRKPSCWNQLKETAEALGQGWKFVRVDLFELHGRIFTGELTFWPMSGCYKGDGQERLGRLIDFDRTTFREPVYKQLRRSAVV